MILDLLKSRGLSPQKKASTHGGEYASPCPACGGHDRFLSWPDQGERGTWYCRHCGQGGDAIEFLRVFDGLSFAEACQRLGIKREYHRKPLTLPKASAPEPFAPKEHALPSPLWQEKAGKLLDFAHNELLADKDQLAKLAARGLPRPAVERFRLGFLPGEQVKKTGQTGDCYYRGRASWGLPEEKNGKGEAKKLWIPRGLVIPAIGQSGEVGARRAVPLLRLRVRRLDIDRQRFQWEMKFVVVPGSFMGPLCLIPSGGAKAFVVVESELDAMACLWAAEQAGLPVGALAVGTNRGKPDAAAHALLAKSAAILVALDYDAPDKNGNRPGAQGFAWWREQYRQAERWPVIVGKDVGEAVAQGMDIADWLRAGLPPAARGRMTEDGRQIEQPPSEREVAAPPPEGVDAKSYEVTLTTGVKFHVTDDRDTWAALMAKNEPAFSRNELKRLDEATGGADALIAAMPMMCAVKRIFAGAYIKDGRSGQHRRASGMAEDYFLAPAVSAYEE